MLDFLVSAGRKAKNSIANRRKKRLVRMVERVIASGEPSRPLDCEELFGRLQNTYAPLPEYGYDAISSWNRASERVGEIISLLEPESSGERALEVGCGDGMVGRLLQVYGYEVVIVDIEDWRDARARSVPFTRASVCSGLPFADESFDFVYSYNSFEHFSSPENAFSEIMRVCRPSGHVYLSFGPLYSSPWGLHAYRTLLMPYPQFLFSERFLEEKLEVLGISDLGRTSTELQHVNRWKVREFESLWNKPGLEVVRQVNRLNEKHLDVILDHPRAFRGRGLSYEDVVTYGLSVLLTRTE